MGDRSLVLVLPVQNILVLVEVEQAEAPKHYRERSLLQGCLAQSQIECVVTQPHFLLKKIE